MENNIQGQYRQVVNLAPPEDREFPRFDDLAAELRINVVLYSGHETSVVTPHDLLDKQLWDHVTSIVVRHPYDSSIARGQIDREHLSLALKFAGVQQRDPDCSNIEEILVWLDFRSTDHPKYPIRRRGNAADLFLGNDAVRVVDLSDSKDDKDIDRALRMDPDSEAARGLHDIRRGRCMYRGEPSLGTRTTTTPPEWWEQLVLKSQLRWLRACFLAEPSASQDYKGQDLFQQIGENDITKIRELVDTNDPWAARMIGDMPKLRPVGVYAENDDSHIQEWTKPPSRN